MIYFSLFDNQDAGNYGVILQNMEWLSGILIYIGASQLLLEL